MYSSPAVCWVLGPRIRRDFSNSTLRFYRTERTGDHLNKLSGSPRVSPSPSSPENSPFIYRKYVKLNIPVSKQSDVTVAILFYDIIIFQWFTFLQKPILKSINFYLRADFGKQWSEPRTNRHKSLGAARLEYIIHLSYDNCTINSKRFMVNSSTKLSLFSQILSELRSHSTSWRTN